MIHILDRQTEQILDVLVNHSDSKIYWNTKMTEALEDNQLIFEFTTLADGPAAKFITPKNKLTAQDQDGFHRLFSIETVEKVHDENGKTLIVTALGDHTELGTEQPIAPQTLEGQTAETAVQFVLAGTRYVPGQIDFAGSRTITFDSYISPLAALNQIASTFELELRFRVEVHNDGTITRVVDLLKPDTVFDGKEIVFGKDLLGIHRKENTDNICTRLIGIGPADADGNIVTFASVNNGKIYVEDDDAFQRWNNAGRHVWGVFEYQPDSGTDVTPQELLDATKKELQNRINSVVEWDVSAAALEQIPGLQHERVRVGMNIRIKDEAFDPAIYLEARVLETEMPELDDPNGNFSYTFGNYREVKVVVPAEVKAIQKILFHNSGGWSAAKVEADIAQQLANEAKTDVEAANARIDNLIAVDITALHAEIQNLEAIKANVEDLNAINGQIENLTASKANVDDLNAVNARIDDLVTNDLTAINAAITNLQAEKADITDLNAVNATIATLQADVGLINTLLAGNLGAENFRAGAIYAGSGVIAQGAIGDAEISNLNASKINAGILNTALVTIQGANGRLKMSGNRLQVFANKTDGSLYERVSLGDVNGDGSVYGLRVRGSDGKTVLLDENGVKSEGITDGSITNDKIADDANISGTKLDIASVVTEINEGTTTIQSSKIFYDGKTLDVQLGSMVNTVTAQSQTITNHEARITLTEQGLATKVSVSQYQQDQAALSSQLSQMSTQIQQQANQIALKADSSNVYTKSQIDGQFTTVNTQISNLSAQLTVQADQIASKVSKTEFDALQVGGRNLLRNTSFTQGLNYWSSGLNPQIIDGYNGMKAVEVSRQNYSGSNRDFFEQHRDDGIIKENQTYTISGWFYIDSSVPLDSTASDIHVRFYKSGSSGTFVDFISIPITLNLYEYDKWYYFKKTGTAPSGYSGNVTISFALGKNGKVRLCGWKLELGNKATDWTPAPEDVQGQIDGLGSRMTTAETSITQLSNQIALKANQSEVDTLAGRMTSAESSIALLTNQINLKANKTDVDNLTTRVSNVEVDIDALNSQISLKANQSTVDTLTGQISSLQAQLTVQADQIATKVEKDGVISAINQSAEQIKIQASKINLVGAVTVLSDITGNLGTINAGTINGVTITSQDKAAGLAISIANGQITGNSSTNNYLTIQPGQFILGLADANYYEPEFQAYPDFLMFIRKTADAYNQNFKISVSPGSTILQQEMLTPNNGFSYGGPKLEFKSDGSYGSYTHSITASADKIIFNGSFQANNFVYTDAIENNPNSGGVNIYISPKNELRVTAPGSTTSYMPLRAANLYAASLDTNTGGSVYVRPSSNGSVHITVTGTTNQYRPIYASEHLTGSLAEYKQDIEPMTESALDIINAAKVHKYRLKSDVENGIDNVKYGLIIGDGYDTPNEFLSADRTAIDSYVVSAISLKAIQELDGKTTEIADDVEWLKTENDYLKQKVNFLENKLKELEAQIA